MKVIYSNKHKLHTPSFQFFGGDKITLDETPERAEKIIDTLKSNNHEIIHPHSYSLDSILNIHSKDYLNYLKKVYFLWNKDKPISTDVIPAVFPNRVPGSKPKGICSMAGWYCFGTTAPIQENTFESAIASASCALTAAELIIEGEKIVYSLCRPPGHHSGSDYCGGYCYLNNAAIAAKHLLDNSTNTPVIAILDIDYHHGNGTQGIFYDSKHVFYVSIHSDPNFEYPYFWGYSSEIGKGYGRGFNLNLPLPKGTGEKDYINALKIALTSINKFNPDVLIISFGADTLINDPVGGFKLSTDSFTRIGENLSFINKPTLIIQEGGYIIGSIGTCVSNFLNGIYPQNHC